MAHAFIEINLPLAKVYELMSSPVDFPKFMKHIDIVNKINSQTFEYKTKIGQEEFQWITNIIDDLRNTRFAWITINGNMNQTGTIRFTPLDNGKRTRVDLNLDYRMFYGEPSEAVANFINSMPQEADRCLQIIKTLAESDTFNEAEMHQLPDSSKIAATA